MRYHRLSLGSEINRRKISHRIRLDKLKRQDKISTNLKENRNWTFN